MALETIIAQWDNEYGYCYNCGWPAAFFVPDAYGTPDDTPKPENIRCAVCAANDACDGERVKRIDVFLGED